MIKVIKLGGTSQDKVAYQNAVKVIRDILKNDKVLVVVSALSQITNMLFSKVDKTIIIKKHFDFIDTLGLKNSEDLKEQINFLIRYTLKNNNYYKSNSCAEILALGEHLTSIIFNKYLNENLSYTENLIEENKLCNDIDDENSDEEYSEDEDQEEEQNEEQFKQKVLNFEYYSKVILATEYLKFTDKNKNLSSLSVDSSKIIDNFKNNDVLVTQGFIASDYQGNPTILMGRGSSDTSGAIFSKFLNAKEYQIWTDVNGIFNTDPRIISKAKQLLQIDFEMAQEMAGLGAKVLHPQSIKPCQDNNIPILIKNSFDIDKKPTIISNLTTNDCAYVLQKNILLVKIKSLKMWHGVGFASHIFDIFKKYNIDIDIITTSQFEITVTFKNDNEININNTINELKLKYEVEVNDKCNIISVVSSNIVNKNMAKIHQLTSKQEILLESISSNKYSVSFVVNEDQGLNLLKEVYYGIEDESI